MRFLKSVLLSFLVSVVLLVAVNPSQAATIIAPTSITTNTTWTSGNVYVVQTSTTVQPGINLTIQPGTVVKFQSSSSFMVIKGTLQASGTSENNIIFTSYKDDTYGGDTNGDGDATSPAKGDWQYIQSYNGGSVNSSYSRIRYGGKYTSIIYSTGGSLNIDHCIIEKSNSNGIEIKGSASITNNQISDCTEKNIYVNITSGSPSISNNTATGAKYGIYALNGSPAIENNSLNSNSLKGIYFIDGSPTISGNTLNGGDLTTNYGIVIENGSAQIANNSITNFPNYEAIQLGKLYGTTSTGVSANITGNTMSNCKYPLGFAGDKIPSISYESNNISGCSLVGIRVHMELSGQQTIPALSLPYVVTNFCVLTGATINIESGAIFKTSGPTNLSIHGNLDAIGIDSNPIVFTSLKDDSFGGDTNNDGNTTLPQPGNWSYIYMAPTGTATFDHVTFQYGAQAIDATLDGYELTVKNCDISKMSYYGIYVRGANSALIESNAIHHNGKGIYCTSSSSPDIKNNDIYNNTRGIDILRSSSAKITDNYIHENSTGIYFVMVQTDTNGTQVYHNNIVGNTSYGIYTLTANDPPVVVAQRNWWGDPSGANPPGNGDAINSQTKIDASNPLPELYVPEAPGEGARQFCRHYDPEKRKWSLVLEPVDSGTGAHVIDKSLISLNGARQIDFNLSYNSLLLDEGVMGKGWSHNYETRLEVQADGSIMLCWSENRDNSFTTTDQVNYTSIDSACRLDSLLKNIDGTYTLTRKDQSKYYFDVSGKLTEQRSGTGMALQMTYDGNGRLATISEPLSGIGLDLSYNTNGLLQSATDDLNRVWQFTYDASNNLTAITYPDNTSSNFTYDAAGQVLSENDPEGNLLFANTYDDQGRVISQDDGISTNQLSTLTYDDTTQPGFLITTITDRTGNSRQYIHDSSYQLVEVIDELGNETTMTYDEDGNRRSITDALGHTTTMTYDDRGNILTITDDDSNTTTMTYDDRNNLLTVTNALNKTISNTYDTDNRLLTISDPDNGVTSFTYDTSGLLLETESPRGGTTTYTYQNGLMTSKTDPTNKTTTFTYDAVGRLISTTNAAGKTSTITYDSKNNITGITDPLGNTMSFTYDGNGKVLTQTDARNYITSYTYDANRNLSSITDPLNNITQFAYDGEDRLVEVTDARGNSSTITYDAKGRKTVVTDALGHTFTTQYDDVDNVIGQIDALNVKVASITYDNLNRPISVTDALDNTSTNTYDAVGNLTQTTNPLDKNTQFTYDNLNRLIETVDAINGEANQEFDADGNRTALVDSNNNRQEFTYDPAGRLTQSSSATGSIQYVYNQIGLLSSLTNGRMQSRSLVYDDAGRPTSQTDPDGSISYTYDANGNLLTVTDSSGTITRQYDALNRVTSYTDARGNTIEYDYDANGNLICLTYPDDKEVHYTYDAANRLTQVEDWGNRVTTYTYDANNRLIQTNRPDGSVETRTYDNAGRLIQQLDKDQSNNVLTQFDFTYNAAGNVTQETNNLPETPLPDEQTTMTYTSDNRLATFNGQNVTYDADGNMTSGPLDGQITNYTFDSRNRLTSVGTTSYTYDAENNRIGVNNNGTVYDYVINPNASLSQVLVRTGTNNSQTFYVYGLGLIGEQTGTDYKVYHYDLRGSTVMLTDSTGASTDTYQYGPYGEVINHTGSSATPFQYCGMYGIQNDGNGLYYMRARYYNPEIQRFVSKDNVEGIITNPLSLNLYTYCNNNPINFVDPTGHKTETVVDQNRHDYLYNLAYCTPDADPGNIDWARHEYEMGNYTMEVEVEDSYDCYDVGDVVQANVDAFVDSCNDPVTVPALKQTAAAVLVVNAAPVTMAASASGITAGGVYAAGEAIVADVGGKVAVKAAEMGPTANSVFNKAINATNSPQSKPGKWGATSIAVKNYFPTIKKDDSE